MLSDRRYLYAIIAGTEPPTTPLTGLNDAPISLLSYQDISAAISPVETDRLEPTTEQLLCHEAVIESLMEQRSTLPVRFGAVLSHPDRVMAVLRERYAGFKADLTRVAGHVELGLRVLWDTDAVYRGCEPDSPRDTIAEDRLGTRYMQARLVEAAMQRCLREQAVVLEAWVRERLAHLVSDTHTRLLATEKMPLSSALLVPRERLDDLFNILREMGWERPDLDLICTGVWPPYHFVKGNE